MTADSSDSSLLAHVHDLVAQEHELRERTSSGELDSDEERRRLQALEVELDRCWDLLRQRQARRSAGLDPAQAHERPAGEVEGYLQ
ncbi:uncharacterized protein DUF2630 [Motilibacter rhizosphaerae]|uniref:Uncharacterized protein DUF2630 n=1 Tax=Motilibacter rhizosphaerae TaxID=598652 RepID=A0A4Q7NUS1_9ACTN|nr:DUF2630 family protein [Motilibacter rhizosphaerae]RZS90875.1 uncharacterized protein DUF2630 [Motilibacter rhizosphaerae]